MVVKRTQIGLGIRIQAFFHELGDDPALDVQRTGGDVHQTGEPLIELGLIGGQVGQPGQVQGHDADGTGGFTGAEIAAGLLAEFAQIKAKAAVVRDQTGRKHEIGFFVVQNLEAITNGRAAGDGFDGFDTEPNEVVINDTGVVVVRLSKGFVKRQIMVCRE